MSPGRAGNLGLHADIEGEDVPDTRKHALAICLTAAFGLSDGNDRKVSVAGSNLTTALARKSVSHTTSWSST